MAYDDEVAIPPVILGHAHLAVESDPDRIARLERQVYALVAAAVPEAELGKDGRGIGAALL